MAGDGLTNNYGVTTPEEIATFRKFYADTKGYSLPALEFWIDHRPDALKRYRANFVRETTSVEESAKPLPHVAAMLHYYAIIGYADGILYEIRLCQSMGMTKGEILDTLAVAFIHGNPMGMRFVSTSSSEYMRDWKEPEPMDRWPAAWSFDSKAFRSGIDFSSPATDAREMDMLRDWYMTEMGEVPRYVQFLAKNRPRYLKAYRNRYEHAISEGLPKEMMPYLLLNLSVTRGFRDGIRESVLLGRSFGMTKPQLLDAICWAYYGGMDGISVADEAAGDIFDQMD